MRKLWSLLLTGNYCETHFIETINSKNQGEFIEMVLTIEHSGGICEYLECNDQATKRVYGKGESPGVGLPTKKEYILQMHK